MKILEDQVISFYLKTKEDIIESVEDTGQKDSYKIPEK